MTQLNFRYITRAVIFSNDCVLLYKHKQGNYAFLPGGHIELGESATQALKREIKEEIGEIVSIKNFSGAIENAWEDECEISLFFEVNHQLTVGKVPKPASQDEMHLEFLWADKNCLEKQNLLPKPLIKILKEPLDIPFWNSTINPER